MDEGQQVRRRGLGQIRRGSRSMTVGLTEREEEGTILYCILENNKCDIPQGQK
jgi:hypothetical protein